MHEILLNFILFKINALLNVQVFNTLCVPNFIWVLTSYFCLISVTQLQVNPEESYKLLYSWSTVRSQLTYVWVFKFVFNSSYVKLFQLAFFFF